MCTWHSYMSIEQWMVGFGETKKKPNRLFVYERNHFVLVNSMRVYFQAETKYIGRSKIPEEEKKKTVLKCSKSKICSCLLLHRVENKQCMIATNRLLMNGTHEMWSFVVSNGEGMCEDERKMKCKYRESERERERGVSKNAVENFCVTLKMTASFSAHFVNRFHTNTHRWSERWQYIA